MATTDNNNADLARAEIDGEPFAKKCPSLLAELGACFGEGERLMGIVREQLKRVVNAR